MPPLLVVPDPPRRGPADAVPELPALSTLLGMGEPGAADPDWRAGVQGELGGAALAGVRAAPVAASATSIAPGRAACLATPVHAVAGISRVHLHDAGVLQLGPGDKALLARSFEAQFGPELQLHELEGGWLLLAPWAAVADDGDPVVHQGAPLMRAPAATASQRAMRRAGAEIEMWLAGLEWNRERERRGQLAANLLWCWGGGETLHESVAAATAFRVRGAADPWAAGLAKLGGHPLAPLPEEWTATQDREVLLLPHAGSTDQWLQWEQRWFAPALRDLQARRIDALRLRLGPRGWLIRRRRWRAIFTRSRPWWQALET